MGGGTQTFHNLYKLAREQRIDKLLWESPNDCGQNGWHWDSYWEANLPKTLSKWQEIKYDMQPYFLNCTSFGLPQNKPKLVAMILNVHDPRTLDFAAKSMHAVFARFRKLCQVCERQHGCASEFLLPDDDPLVLQDLKRRQHIAANRQPEGYDFNKAIAALKLINVDWASLKPTHQLESSRWYKTLTPCEQDKLLSLIHI